MHLFVIYIHLHSLSLHEHEAECKGRFTRISVERSLITNWTEIRGHQIRAQIIHFITRGLLPKLPSVGWLARSVELARLGPPYEDADIRKKDQGRCTLCTIAD